MSQPIRLETDESGQAIGGVLCQQDVDMNSHPVAYYSCKMLPAKRNYETYDVELLAMIEAFKTWRHYLERAAHTIFPLIDHNNLKKFIETTRLSLRQIRWSQKLSRYNFKIYYRPKTKTPADALSRSFLDKDNEKELVEQNRKILDRLQHSLSENHHSLLNAICQAVPKSTMCDEEIHFLEHCTEILKVLIAGTTAIPKVKKLWSHINDFL